MHVGHRPWTLITWFNTLCSNRRCKFPSGGGRPGHRWSGSPVEEWQVLDALVHLTSALLLAPFPFALHLQLTLLVSLGLQASLAIAHSLATCYTFLVEVGGDNCGEERPARSEGLAQEYLAERLERWFALSKCEDLSSGPRSYLANQV